MAYASMPGGGYGATASVIPNAHGDTVSVPDAELLFNGDFRRAGPDLVLTGHDGRHHLVPGYFSGAKKALVAPNGASLSPDLVDLLAGSPAPGQYAQAQQTTPADAIGKVEKAIGNVTAIRNGVAVALHVGDPVFKSDIIQTGANSSAGIGFPDGTALNLIANTRMALNDYSYDPNGTSNVALVSLVQGTFAFVAGRVAHTGDMKIETPVATMGIRGTTGWVQEIASVTANLGNVSYSFAVVDDFNSTGHGQYDLIDANGNIIATVSQTGYVTYVTPQGVGQAPLVSTEPMSNSQLGFEQQIIQQVFQVLNSINQSAIEPGRFRKLDGTAAAASAFSTADQRKRRPSAQSEYPRVGGRRQRDDFRPGPHPEHRDLERVERRSLADLDRLEPGGSADPAAGRGHSGSQGDARQRGIDQRPHCRRRCRSQHRGRRFGHGQRYDR